MTMSNATTKIEHRGSGTQCGDRFPQNIGAPATRRPADDRCCRVPAGSAPGTDECREQHTDGGYPMTAIRCPRSATSRRRGAGE